ncbi:MAG: helix-turn-helix domain-containing protein [Actinobacteria bacterium]|nr:helix-turn-helix domain-containing protein [Actinomycetota bacterium]
MNEKFYTEKETAEILGLSRQSLANWRSIGKGPSFVKFCGAVRYASSSITEFIDRSTVRVNCE